MTGTPILIHEPRDHQLPWQWWASGATRENMQFSTKPMDKTHTWLAGFPTEEAARHYGERCGYVVPAKEGA